MTQTEARAHSAEFSMADVLIEPALAADLGAVRSLLLEAGLPDLDAERFPDGYVVIRRNAVVACAALEVYAADALLRSVAVASTWRGRGLGRLLVEDRLNAAALASLSAVHLLTTSAADYFTRLGFRVAARQEAPHALRQASEFTTVCPASAAYLCKPLAGR